MQEQLEKRVDKSGKKNVRIKRKTEEGEIGMATIEIRNPSTLVLEFWQEKSDEDYGTCLWARFYFDKQNYTLTMDSDCGTYGYGWVPTPTSESFLKLMSRIDEGYLLDKISSRSQVNEIITLKNIKELVSNNLGFYDMEFSEVMEAEYLTEYDLKQIEAACNYGDERSVGEAMTSAIGDIDSLSDIDDYDIWNAIETDFPCNAKKIASVFVNFIEPKIKEILMQPMTPQTSFDRIKRMKRDENGQ